MDKVSLLCEHDRAMLIEFSKRTIRRLTRGSPHALLFPFVDAYLDANVMKEIRKDRMIIERAAAVFPPGRRMRDLDAEAVFEETKSVDRKFVKALIIPSFSVTVRYEDIAEIRKKRIICLSQAVRDVLGTWKDSMSFEEAVRATYSETRFRKTVMEILHHYNLETRMLSKSIRFLPLFHAAVDLFADTLFDAMEASATDLSQDCTKAIYKGTTIPA